MVCRDGRRVGIVQSSYIPWKGYFDLIDSVDDFVLLDTVQYSRRGWRNRNRIKTRQGIHWLTIPVATKGTFGCRIDEVRTENSRWPFKHLETIGHAYRRAACFQQAWDFIRDLYQDCPTCWLTEINEYLIRGICAYLGISTRIWHSSQFDCSEDRTARLVEICQALHGTEYVTGPTAKVYLDEALFIKAGMSVVYFHYEGFPTYSQLHPPYVSTVSIVDPILNLGSLAPNAVLRPDPIRSEEMNVFAI